MTTTIKSTLAVITSLLMISVATIARVNAAPAISQLTPASAQAGSDSMTLSLDGSGFSSTSMVGFGTHLLPTTEVSDSEVTAVVSKESLSHAGTVKVWVTNGEGNYSQPVQFNITKVESTKPTITGIDPSSTAAGSSDFTLTVTGTGFDAKMSVRFGDRAVKTTFVSSTQLTALVPAVAVAKAGTVPVTVSGDS